MNGLWCVKLCLPFPTSLLASSLQTLVSTIKNPIRSLFAVPTFLQPAVLAFLSFMATLTILVSSVVCHSLLLPILWCFLGGSKQINGNWPNKSSWLLFCFVLFARPYCSRIFILTTKLPCMMNSIHFLISIFLSHKSL